MFQRVDDDPFDTDINRSVISSFTSNYIDDWQGWNYVTQNNTITDDNGHGTHVKTIAAVGNLIDKFYWNCTIREYHGVDEPNGQWIGRTSSTIAAIDYAINEGADLLICHCPSTIQTVSMDDVEYH